MEIDARRAGVSSLKWLAGGTLIWTAVVAATAYFTYSPRDCSPIDHDCLSARSADAWIRGYLAAGVWFVGLLFGMYLWWSVVRGPQEQ